MIKDIRNMKIDMRKENENINFIDLGTEELILFINELYLNKMQKFTIIDCLYDLNLFEVNLKTINKEIDISLGNILAEIPYENKVKDFLYNRLISDKEKNDFKNISSNFFKEFPHKNQLKDVFRNTGIFFNDTNQSKFENVFNKIKGLNFLNGDLPIAFSFDTCTYINQTFSHLYKFYNEKYSKIIKNIDFLVSKGVIDELSRFENKYNIDNVNSLKILTPYPNIVGKLLNQNKLNTRLLHLGHIDYLKCQTLTNTKLIEKGDSKDKDMSIINGLASYVENNNIMLYLFSHDSDFDSRASSGFPNVHSCFLKRADINDYHFNKFSCDWELFTRFLYYLSILFGAIILNVSNKEKFIIYGIWIGKRKEDWKNERVRVYSHNPVLTRIKKDLEIMKEK